MIGDDPPEVRQLPNPANDDRYPDTIHHHFETNPTMACIRRLGMKVKSQSNADATEVWDLFRNKK